MKISRGDLVLEIGSGHRPTSRSDVLLDMFITNTEERAGKIIRNGKPLINAKGEELPFKDKAFNYVICKHVLEHSADPGLFLKEIQRVGKRGFIEAPTPIWELIYTPRTYHRCLFYWDKQENQLLVKLRRNDEYSQFGRLFAYIYENDIFFRLFHNYNQELLYTRLEWEESIPYRILEPEEQILPDLYDYQAIQQLLGSKMSLGSKRGKWAYHLITYISRKIGL